MHVFSQCLHPTAFNPFQSTINLFVILIEPSREDAECSRKRLCDCCCEVDAAFLSDVLARRYKLEIEDVPSIMLTSLILVRRPGLPSFRREARLLQTRKP